MIKSDEAEFEMGNYTTPKIDAPVSSFKRFKGESVRLLCLDNKIPRVGSVEWKKNGFSINTGNRRFKNSLNEFQIEKLDFIDSGVYECHVNKQLKALIELSVVSKLGRIDEDQLNLVYDQIIKKLMEIFCMISIVYLYFVFFSNCVKTLMTFPIEGRPRNASIINHFIKLNLSNFEQNKKLSKN